MKNIWTYNTLKTNHSGWVQLTEMGEWCIKICVLQTIFYNVAWYGVTLTKHICLNAGTKTRAGALQLYHAEMLTFVLCTEGCHVGLFREFVGMASWTYGQSNTTIATAITIVQTHDASIYETSRGLMEGINMEKSSQGCYKAMQLSQ